MSNKKIIICLILIFIISLFIGYLSAKYFKNKKEDLINKTNEVISKKVDADFIIKDESNEDIIGKIIINKINLEAPIKEGTDKKTLRYAVGHFESSSLWSGNVALAAHNGGSLYNYFSKLNKLEIGDEIIYKTVLGERRYEVYAINNIKSDDWSEIQNTKENTITLITCIKNNSSLRLCIKGIEK